MTTTTNTKTDNNKIIINPDLLSESKAELYDNSLISSYTDGTQQLCCVTTCNLNQFSLDFNGNLNRIKKSIIISKKLGSKLRNGCELEISGYGCEDHFLENDTYLHCWESIKLILLSNLTNNILCCFGIPINHKNILYNCFIWILNNKILLIRPKLYLANNGNYREMRYFNGWESINKYDEYILPKFIYNITKQKYVPFGC